LLEKELHDIEILLGDRKVQGCCAGGCLDFWISLFGEEEGDYIQAGVVGQGGGDGEGGPVTGVGGIGVEGFEGTEEFYGGEGGGRGSPVEGEAGVGVGEIG
jgi:hypothetical protein